jgi:predicted transposase YdaD
VELTDTFRPETIHDRKLMALWLRFLKEVGENMKSLPPEMQENEDIRQAAELCEEGAFTDIELAAYEKYWDIISYEKTLYRSALLKGEAKGEAKGMAKGNTERSKLKAKLDAVQKLAEQQAAQIAELQHQLDIKH